MTRLSSFSTSNRLHSRINSTRQSLTIRPQIPVLGLTTHFSPISMSSMSGPSRSKAVKSRDLSRELEDGIIAWDGPAIFSTTPASPLPSPQRHRAEERWGQGTSSSPIDISSAEPSPVKTRIRGIPAYNSPLPRTAYTSPSKPTPIAPGQVHPFFNRTKSLPPPASNRPRMVAHYSSTETESSQQTEMGDTQSSFGGPSQSPSKKPLERITVAPHLPKIEKDVKGKGKGKIPDAGFSDEAIEDMANEFSNVEIGRKSILMGRIKVSNPKDLPPYGQKAKTTSTISKVTAGPSKIIPKVSSSTTSSKSNPPISKGAEVEDPSLDYFQYQKCPNPPAVVYTTDPSEANDLIDCLKGDVFGFDLEWPSRVKQWDKAGKFSLGQGRTALVQICDQHTIILLHMKKKSSMSVFPGYKLRHVC